MKGRMRPETAFLACESALVVGKWTYWENSIWLWRVRIAAGEDQEIAGGAARARRGD